MKTVRAQDVATLLDTVPPGIEVLSLDCFDTLVWRNTSAPTDVFADLAIDGGGMQPRIWAEGTARRLIHSRERRAEIGLEDVYRHLYPAADEAEIAERTAAELAIEARHAFAFTPVVRLMQEAKRRGLTIVIVSDMYMRQEQLRAHIASAAGEDVLAMIDHVFVSADHGRGKCDDLFDIVLKKLAVKPEAVLHLGDNLAADYDAARQRGIHAVHFRQFDAESHTRLRHEASAASMIDPAARSSRVTCQPHRAAVALRRDDDPAAVLGHDVMGPVLHTFALWLRAELDEMAARLGRPVRPLFMMRDGYLPLRVFDQMFPDAGAAPVEISRFAATRASLCEPRALDAYLGDWLHRLPVRTLARQLMLFENEVAKFVRPLGAQEPVDEFARFVSRPDMRRKIETRAGKFADKLVAHLAAAGVEPGDAVMLVDVGYNGTAQNLLTPVLASRMALSVSGRYLFLREAQISGLDKRGLLDAANHDCRTLHAMSSCVVVIEQLCNVEQGSTVDYDVSGAPIREAADVKAAHSAIRDKVQRACLTFAADAEAGIWHAPASDDLASRRHAAAAILARLLFLPNPAEIALLDTFNYDMNMGTALSGKLFDAQSAALRMRRRGLSFLDERPRAFAAAEVHGHGLPISLALFASTRFALDLRATDFQVGGIEVPVMIATATGQHATTVTAHPTAEGYYQLRVPVSALRPTLAIQFGVLCEVVQIEEIGFLKLEELTAGHPGGARLAPATAVPDGCETLAPDLFRMTPAGFILVPPPAAVGPAILSLVFRPVRWRSQATALRAAS